jgi:hypothetical protein
MMYVLPDTVKPPAIPAFMEVTANPIRCRLDGAIVDYSVYNGQASIDEGPFPVYEFECRLCDQVDEIS